MKKLLLALSFTVAAVIANAQNFWGSKENKITYGLSGGSDFAFLQTKSPYSAEVNPNSESPFSLGFNADFSFNNYFSFRPGILYAGKGGTMNPGYVDPLGNNVSVYDDYKLHYLEVLIDFIGHLPFSSGANIFLGAGPYFARGLNGTNNQTFSYGSQTQKIKFGKTGDFKQSDYGVTTVFGFQAAKGWSVSGNIDWGLNNILQTNNTGFDLSRLSTVTLYFSIGQRF